MHFASLEQPSPVGMKSGGEEGGGGERGTEEEEGGCGAWRGRGRKEESCRWLTIWLLRSGPAAVPTSPCHADVLSSAGPGRGSRVRTDP